MGLGVFSRAKKPTAMPKASSVRGAFGGIGKVEAMMPKTGGAKPKAKPMARPTVKPKRGY